MIDWLHFRVSYWRDSVSVVNTIIFLLFLFQYLPFLCNCFFQYFHALIIKWLSSTFFFLPYLVFDCELLILTNWIFWKLRCLEIKAFCWMRFVFNSLEILFWYEKSKLSPYSLSYSLPVWVTFTLTFPIWERILVLFL